jgi:hypothetical protein
MRQIYYTQCPIGYGLGASNGFQIKRLSPGYPISGDFRHLGLRAFVAGTRTLSPPALRYRRGEDGAAEVAWLSPRSHEYETERGPWGRPGGHFAHGLLLDDGELAAIDDWPAGLHDRPFWARADREPSRGQPPADLGLSATDLGRPPTFEAVAPLADMLDPERLAVLLTATAWAARDGRTLFLIDEPGRLADLVALLTFAFPAPWRAELTFSTYHDRPEELPGFRLQGTTPQARPNLPALLAQGIVAEPSAGTIDPAVEPARWARTLAGWLVSRGDDDREAWEATRRRARRARPPDGAGAIWSDEWLDRSFAFEALLRGAASGPPGDASGWTELAEMAAWAGRAGLADEWADARRASWWATAVDDRPEALKALLAHLKLDEAWRDEGDPAAWGAVVAPRVAGLEPEDRRRVLGRALRATPSGARPGFVRALVAALPADVAKDTVAWLEGQPDCDRALLLPLKVRGAIADAVEGRDPRPLREILAEASSLPAGPAEVLDALDDEAEGRPEARDPLATILAGSLASAGGRAVAHVVAWALRRPDAGRAWLGRYLHRLFADPLNADAWREMLRDTPPDLRPALARVVLAVAPEPTLPDEPFRWGVEEVLLPLAEADRPHDPSWPGAYVDRLPGLRLFARLIKKDYQALGVRRWLDQAASRGELSAEQRARIDAWDAFSRILKWRDAQILLNHELPRVRDEERGDLLDLMVRYLVKGGDDSLSVVLGACRAAWPRGFDPGARGLDGVARALAGPLLEGAPDVARWFERLVAALGRLGLTDDGRGFEPDGLAAAIVAETTRREGAAIDPWRLRQWLLQHDAAWPALTQDVRRDLAGGAVKALERWDRSLVKGLHTRRFFELWLNACDGAALAASAAARAAELKPFGSLHWWDASRVDGARDDVRDRFARLAPMAPIDGDALPAVQNWLRTSRRPEATPASPTMELEPLPVEDVAAAPRRESAEGSPLSDRGRVRWRCIEALSAFHRPGLDAGGRWKMLGGWGSGLRLGELEAADRYRFLAWLIRGLAEDEAANPEYLARWLLDCGISDPDRVALWADELDGLADVTDDLRSARRGLVGKLRAELKALARPATGPPR